MTTPAIRTALIDEITSLVAPLPVFNLANYVSIEQLPVNTTEECLLLDFVVSAERRTTIGAPSTLGYEESGTLAITWLCPTGFESAPVLDRAEAFRLSLRSRRIGKVLVETMEPFLDTGGPVDIDGGWTGYTSYLFFSLTTCG